jgi:excisionase family DNA binding protein
LLPLPHIDALAEALADRLTERLAAATARRYLCVAQAADYSGLSVDSIRSLLSSGRLTSLRPVPGRVIIDRRELDALLQSSIKRPRRGRGIYDRAAESRSAAAKGGAA